MAMTDAIVRFNIPDFSVPAKERVLFAFTASKEVADLKIPLHDARTYTNIVQGPDGLDAQGFAYITHHSALSTSDRWFTGQDLEEVYLPEVCDLICEVTDAKKAIVNNCAFRRRLADVQRDPKKYYKKGDVSDQELENIPRNATLVYRKEEGGSLEPARGAHVDYTAVELASTVRECRRDIAEMAKEVIAAEDAQARGEEGVVMPRYAAYSVWRPVKPVRRDPLVVCDYRMLDKDDLGRHQYRVFSEQNEGGEYIMEYWSVAPPKDINGPKWYWMPEQKPDEVLVIKFADTAAEVDSSIAKCCAHAAGGFRGQRGKRRDVVLIVGCLHFGDFVSEMEFCNYGLLLNISRIERDKNAKIGVLENGTKYISMRLSASWFAKPKVELRPTARGKF